MTVTATPIFPQTPNVGAQGALLSTAATAAKFYDGTDAVGTNMQLLFTADAVNGGRIDGIRIKLSGTAGAAPSGTTNACKFHVFINNGQVNTTAANNSFFTDTVVPAVTMSNTALVGEWTINFPTGFSIAAGNRIYVNSQAANGATNGAFALTAFGGNY